ncbi:hypothetical protein [Flavobacterium eburneipallidum]|uniref:hypothetical protein n=1 Tax=Flavobacterium eburneipallidum TaxID=3003263 RepID=UPI002482B7A6|nr:hypothetical protein [Flavobacterium eburneipallidum]
MDKKIVNIINEESFLDKDGLDYIKITKEILTPRKTYLKGTISGKYRGDKIPDVSDKSDLFDFEIYEAEVNCNSIDDFSKNKAFEFPKDFKNITNQNKIRGSVFPKEKLPKILAVQISANNNSFGINVLEPQLFEFEINRKYHQTDGEQVYGTFNAYITGYVFDYEREEVVEIIEKPILATDEKVRGIYPPLKHHCESNDIKTGNVEKKDGYIRYEYFCKHHQDTVWGNRKYIGTGSTNQPFIDNGGCLKEIFGILGLLVGLFFLITILPGFLYIIGFWILTILLGWLAPYLKWIFRIIGVILLFAFLASLLNAFIHRSHTYNPYPIPTPTIVNPPVYSPIVDSTSKKTIDEWITINRKWQDYDNNIYQGKYKIKKSDLTNSKYYKNNLSLIPSTSQSYDQMIYSLKENDKNNISSIYHLFDSIGKANRLDKIKFAKMIVTFVQDLPYAVVLENECNGNLYNDEFTKKYLSTPNANCDPFERFGINTPIEFLVNQKGDCDTRTLLLYTLLAHYDYDITLMSSEFYSHSIIGINLPIIGTAYIYNNQKYVLWETTTISKPGVISKEISILNNWRISLKSK